MFTTLRSDIRCILDRDPAARNALEVFICYPGFHAVRAHRCAHFLHRHGCKLIARMLSNISRFFTGIEIHPAAQIGKRLFIDHGMGVVIGETTVIGDDVTIYQGATLGGTGKETGKRHPTIGSHVMVASGARILGPVVVGDYARVGAGAVVLQNVPPCSTIVGVPGRVVRTFTCPDGEAASELCRRREACANADVCCRAQADGTEQQAPVSTGENLDQISLPDPVEMEIAGIQARIAQLEAQLKTGAR